jgi:S-adenosylmethionine hydrolase
MNKLITITTDFGDSFAAAQLMAVIANFDYGGRIAENHSVTPFSIAEGAFEIQVTSMVFSDSTTIVKISDNCH